MVGRAIHEVSTVYLLLAAPSEVNPSRNPRGSLADLSTCIRFHYISNGFLDCPPCVINMNTGAKINITTLGNMEGVIGYSYTGLGNGVVVIYWVGCKGEYRNNLLMG